MAQEEIIFSSRMHCIPCYNFIANVKKVKRLPLKFRFMEQKTAGGIVKKAKNILDSSYFESLPETAVVKTGNRSYTWVKSEAADMINQVWSETFGKH